MKQKVDEEHRICYYCEHSMPIMESDACVCRKKGLVCADGCCRHFSLDVFKINPRRPRAFESADSDWFHVF